MSVEARILDAIFYDFPCMSNPVFVIAEAGVNHNGDIGLALELIDVAAATGADAVKFQSFQADHLVTRSAQKAQYQIDNTGESGGQHEMLARLQLTGDSHRILVERCAARGIAFMSTAFDAGSLELLVKLGMPAIKVPSGDITCAPMLLQAAQLKQRLIVSTGMSTLADIEQALGVLAFGLTREGVPANRADCEAAYVSTDGRKALARHVTLLHCVTQYPAPPEAVHLRAMDTMAAAFGLPVGYSDHTAGIEIAIAAVARGASVIEKHFTLDRNLPGPDHAASLEPTELAQMVRSIRAVELALGLPLKQPAATEIGNRAVARRSIVAGRAIAQGERLDLQMLACKRPGNGMSPMDIWALQGRVATRNYAPDDAISQ